MALKNLGKMQHAAHDGTQTIIYPVDLLIDNNELAENLFFLFDFGAKNVPVHFS